MIKLHEKHNLAFLITTCHSIPSHAIKIFHQLYVVFLQQRQKYLRALHNWIHYENKLKECISFHCRDSMQFLLKYKK